MAAPAASYESLVAMARQQKHSHSATASVGTAFSKRAITLIQ